MVNFKKNKVESAEKKHRHRYELHSDVEDEATDVALSLPESEQAIAQDVKPGFEQSEKMTNAVHEPQEELKTPPPPSESLENDKLESSGSEKLNEKIATLVRGQNFLKQQLKIAIKDFDKQRQQLELLESMSRPTLPSYAGLAIAAILMLGVAGAAVIIGHLQRDVQELKTAISALQQDEQVLKKTVSGELQQMDTQIELLDAKSEDIDSHKLIADSKTTPKQQKSPAHESVNYHAALATLATTAMATKALAGGATKENTEPKLLHQAAAKLKRFSKHATAKISAVHEDKLVADSHQTKHDSKTKSKAHKWKKDQNDVSVSESHHKKPASHHIESKNSKDKHEVKSHAAQEKTKHSKADNHKNAERPLPF